MAKKVSKKAGKSTGISLEDFMADLSKDENFVDLNNMEEEFYKFDDFSLNRALGGGLPAGQIYALQGPSGAGKTLMALDLARTVIEAGKRVFYFDVENKISVMALEHFGLYKNPNFIIFSVGVLEDALEKMFDAIESELFGLIIIDSVDALTTDEQEERDIHDGSKVGGYKAKVLSEWLGSVKYKAAKHGCSIGLIRQVRDNVGVMYGNPETTSGGKAIEFYATTVLRVGRSKGLDVEVDGKIIYQGATIKILKMNQGALPNAAVEVRFYIGDDAPWGFDKFTSVFEEAKRLGVLAPAKKGSSKYLPCPQLCERLDRSEEEISFNGKEKTMYALKNDEELYDAVCEILEEAGGKPVVAGEEDEDLAVDFEEDFDE